MVENETKRPVEGIREIATTPAGELRIDYLDGAVGIIDIADLCHRSVNRVTPKVNDVFLDPNTTSITVYKENGCNHTFYITDVFESDYFKTKLLHCWKEQILKEAMGCRSIVIDELIEALQEAKETVEE